MTVCIVVTAIARDVIPAFNDSGIRLCVFWPKGLIDVGGDGGDQVAEEYIERLYVGIVPIQKVQFAFRQIGFGGNSNFTLNRRIKFTNIVVNTVAQRFLQHGVVGVFGNKALAVPKLYCFNVRAVGDVVFLHAGIG